MKNILGDIKDDHINFQVGKEMLRLVLWASALGYLTIGEH
jgi:hypothetical protein